MARRPTGADAGTACTVGAWPAADPSVTGPFATTTENNVGPAAGQGADGGAPVAFTLFRPTDLAQGGLCHPVITWGNGTGTTPSIYRVLLTHLASHGFVVIASNSPNVAQGNPPPMVAGVTWVLQQNADPTSVMYQRIDTTHVGATGHSQGGFATTTAGTDSHILTIAPIAGATATKNLHGPALLLCGGMDTTVPCSTVMSAFTGITNQPVMLADQLAATHGGWVSFRAGTLNPYEVAVTAWMRLQLMGDYVAAFDVLRAELHAVHEHRGLAGDAEDDGPVSVRTPRSRSGTSRVSSTSTARARRRRGGPS